MHISTIIIGIQVCCTTLMFAKGSRAQEMNLNLDKASVKQVFKKIEQQASVTFVYDAQVINKLPALSLHVNNQQLADVLTELQEKTKLQFKLVGNFIGVAQNLNSMPVLTVNGTATQSTNAIKITGLIHDATGQPLIGVSVSIKGTTKGSQSDVNGRFSIDANIGDVLVFTYIGYAKKEIIINTPAELSVLLDEDSKQLSEVVVTALGIKKERRSLGYSVSEVKGSELTTAREVNVANSLVGKVAGVNVTSVSGGPGSASNIYIRGNASLSSVGGNQPLYVINGVPMVNNSISSGTMNGGIVANNGGQYDNSPDLGDGIGNINPDDIESISVLKGAAAAALYGYRAKYGVILITTKSGSGKGSIEFNSNYVAETVINTTDYQYAYGSGALGKAPLNDSAAYEDGNLSWGSKLDGHLVPQFDGVSRPYVAQKNNVDNFYRTGGTFTNTVAFSKAYDNAAIRLSASDLHNTSIIPNSGYDRHSFDFTGNFSPIKRLTIDARINYITDQGHNRPILGDGAGNSNFQVAFLPTSINVNDLKGASGQGTKADGSELSFTDNAYATNPWFAAYKFINNTNRNRIIASASARYTFDNGLFAQVRIGQDYYNERFTAVVPTGAGYYAQATQNYADTYNTVYEQNTDFLIGKAFKISNDFTITPNIGGNLQKDRTVSTTEAGVGFVVPFVYNIENTSSKSVYYSNPRSDVNSLYATLEFNYKAYLYLSGTAREDWFSTLTAINSNNKDNIIYPGVSGSFVFSELWKPTWLDYGKFRVGYAGVGGGASEAYQTALYYGFLAQQLHGQPLGTINNVNVPNNALKPSNATELEIGTELHLLHNRLSLDVAWYNKLSGNEIVNVPASITSGYEGAVFNLGKLRNRGVEALISGSPVKTKDFTWTTSLNGAYNNNVVLALSAGQSQQSVATSRTGMGFIQNIVGKASDQVVAFDYQRDATGKIITDPKTGIPLQGALKPFGSAFGPWSAGFSNEFTYKRLVLSFLIDGKFGGKIFSGTDYYAYQDGLSKETLPGRETGFGPGGTTNAQTYYQTLGNNVSAEFVKDASFIKFRQLTFGYTFPTNLFNGAIQSLTLSAVGRNLFTIMKHTDNIDPESSYGGISQGLELGGVMPTRTYGLNLGVKF